MRDITKQKLLLKCGVGLIVGWFGRMSPRIIASSLNRWCNLPFDNLSLIAFCVCFLIGYLFVLVLLTLPFKKTQLHISAHLLAAILGGVFITIFRLGFYYACSGTLDHPDTISWGVQSAFFTGAFFGVLISLLLSTFLISTVQGLKDIGVKGNSN